MTPGLPHGVRAGLERLPALIYHGVRPVGRDNHHRRVLGRCPIAEDTDMPRTLVLLAAELLLASRVSSAARRAGFAVRQVRDPAKLANLPVDDNSAPNVLVADLTLPGALDAAVKWQESSGRRAIGFCPHVATDLLRSARSAGLARVMVHSQLDSALPQVLATLQEASGPSSTTSEPGLEADSSGSA